MKGLSFFEKERNNMFLVLRRKAQCCTGIGRSIRGKEKSGRLSEGEDCIVSWCLGHLAEYAILGSI